MLLIEKAILHILDFTGGEAVLSSQELMLEVNAIEFLNKHIEKTIGSQDAKNGTFYNNSEFAKKLNSLVAGELDFVAFTQDVAQQLYHVLETSEDARNSDLFFAQVRRDDIPYLVIFKCTNATGYVHNVFMTEDGSVSTELLNSNSLLPGLTQKMEEFAYINLDSKEVLVKGKKYNIDGNVVFALPELLLECGQAPSPSDTIKEIKKAAKKVADAYCQDQVETAAAVKTYIAENVQEDGQLDPVAVGEAVFKDKPNMQADFQQEIEQAGVKEPVPVDKEATLKKMRKHRLSTDTGIELSIPTEFFENTEFVEFFKEEDGSMSITLKNIQNISNKG